MAELSDLYTNRGTPVRRRERSYPCLIEACEARLDQVLGVDYNSAPIDSGLRADGEAHLRALTDRRASLFDGPVIAMSAIERGRVSAQIASYFDAIRTCDSLRAEYLGLAREERERVQLPDLPLRKRVHELAQGDPIYSGNGRAAAVGVSVLLVCRDADPPGFLIGRRRSGLATDPGIWHVCPSGTLSPRKRGNELFANVEEELQQEITSFSGLSLSTIGESIKSLRLLGLGHDLLRLKPEVILLLESDLESPDSADTGRIGASDEFDEYRLVPLTRDGLEDFWRTFAPDELTPAAAAAAALAELHLL